MADHRIWKHPILPTSSGDTIVFRWDGRRMTARRGETIAAALFAHGIHVFGHHPKDGTPQGLFCANGQCAQCLVLADGKPVKACMTPVIPDMDVLPMDRLPNLPEISAPPAMGAVETIETDVLILGGGPAGMSAAIELGAQSIPTVLVDDKGRLGGKLVLQTHRFFGSTEAVYAGTRGIRIAEALAEKVRSQPTIEPWLNSTALAVYGDQRVGILRGNAYVLVRPRILIVATGARERALIFAGNTLPGVYGAGAFQTLVNRDMVRTAKRLFIIGGGNVGLIAGYHALQAGIDVVGLVEAMERCGGYEVHANKLRRLGMPIYTSHTILNANGKDHVESATIVEIDDNFQAMPGTERTFACDTILIAVGLNPVDEFTAQARRAGLTSFDAGDAQAIAEASAAIFTGKIAGRQAANALGRAIAIPETWRETAEILKSHPGEIVTRDATMRGTGVYPVLHCRQEIPCDPCTAVCPKHLIQIPGGDIRHVPVFAGDDDTRACIGCGRCVTTCPGLAITLVDHRGSSQDAVVSIPYEFLPESVEKRTSVTVTSREGDPLGQVDVVRVRAPRDKNGTTVVEVSAPPTLADRVAGIRIRDPDSETQDVRTDADDAKAGSPQGEEEPVDAFEAHNDEARSLSNDAYVCRCERVTAGEIRAAIADGCRDLNELKAATRVGMGACGGKTCTPLVLQLFREAGVPLSEVTESTPRPLFVEVPLGTFASGGASDPSKEPDT